MCLVCCVHTVATTMPTVPTFREVTEYRIFPIALMILNILGAFGCGTYSIFLLITWKMSGLSSIRTAVALIYLIIFSVIVPSAEIGMMEHPSLAKFTRFLLSPVGRAFLYIFMGGVLLGAGVGGWIVGIYLMAVGVLNLAVSCCL